ncbi:MAG: undecaprenyl-diphosphatase UppP [Candidatus Promineifilaceae bacterium]|jgi:undecaprenyl-diphosphatase
MSVLEAIILGIIQGATEFLPISSSGHLVLMPAIFGLTQPSLNIIAVAHLGTLLAVLIYFRRDLWNIITAVITGLIQRSPMQTTDSRLGWYIAVGSIPAAAAGLLFSDFFDEIFGTPTIAAFFLLVTAGLLVWGERMLTGEKELSGMKWLDAIAIGLFQMMALFPGVSRSGSTITGGLWRGLDRATAARYSFLLGVPAILGAGLLSILHLQQSGELLADWQILLAAFASAAVVGYLCIYFLLAWLRSHSLYIFAVYCALLGGGYLLATLVLS